MAVQVHHGAIGEYVREREDWSAYCERLEQYFAANDVADAGKQRAILLSSCGPETYQLIRNLSAPEKPTEKTFAALVKLVKEHHTPPPSITVQRFTFNTRSQKEGETVAQFGAELRRLSEHCAFEATLDDMLRDRLVCRVRDVRIQRRLLAEPSLEFKKAFQIAQGSESADRNCRDLQRPAAPVHSLPSPSIYSMDKKCYRCGGSNHTPLDCRFKTAECHNCHKTGHLAKVCRSKASTDRTQRPAQGRYKKRRGVASQHRVTEPPELPHALETDDTYTMYHLGGRQAKPRPMTVVVALNNADLEMEVDTGASFSIVSEATFERLWVTAQAPCLRPTTLALSTYTGEKLDVKGTAKVTLRYGSQHAELDLTVVAGAGPSLLGRDWLQVIKLDWNHLNQITSAASLQEVLAKHKSVFKDELGLVKDAEATIHVDAEAQPRFFRPRTIPYALRDRVNAELDRLEQTGIIEPVRFADWAAPIVPVVKKDGSIRVCGDFKVTVNKVAKVDTYPLPRIEDLLASLGRGKSFTKLDLAHAYLQIPFAEDSKKYVVINTSKGLYRYNRLPFGIASAPSIFQRTMEGVLQGIPNVTVYIDDILVVGPSEQEHLRTLDQVLTRLEAAGMRLKQSKCLFMRPSVEYLGHIILAEGLKPTGEKVRAMSDAPAPKNLAQLRSFLGLMNYYSKFLSNLSSTLAPLYALLHKKSQWKWGKEQERAFSEAKSQLTSSSLLVHFDPDKKLTLACDASPYGIGAVLSHVMEDGTEKPVAFASRTLAPAEQKYAQLDKEGLAIVFGVKKFHHYLFGRHFTIRSDHKPLEQLFSDSRPVPAMASARIQRWALTLSAYSYTISYKPGGEHGNADGLSLLPLPEAPTEIPLPGETILLMDNLQGSPVSARDIHQWTNRDPLLSSVRRMVLHGWDHTVKEELQPFAKRKDELSVQDGCILWGSRVVVPPTGRKAVLDELHAGHPGISRMKGLARSVVWWPGIDAQLEEGVRSCTKCQETRKSPASVPLHPWEWPSKPWERVHIDHAGPFLGKTFLVVVDAHSKWLDVIIVPDTASRTTISKLRSVFAVHGLPEIVVSDNGTSFTSQEFAEFMTRNGIRHLKSAPYHPVTNGLAERAVQTFKAGLKKATTHDLELSLSRFLFQYRITPHSTTGATPAEMLMGRRLRSHLDVMHPNMSSRVRESQNRMKTSHDRRAQSRQLDLNDQVYAKNFASGPVWLPGVITSVKGPYTYEATLADGRVWRRHIDHLRIRTDTPTVETAVTDDCDLPTTIAPEDPEVVPQAIPRGESQDGPPPRRSTRAHTAPTRFDPSLY